MSEAKLDTISKFEEFLLGSAEVEFTPDGCDAERYGCWRRPKTELGIRPSLLIFDAAGMTSYHHGHDWQDPSAAQGEFKLEVQRRH